LRAGRIRDPVHAYVGFTRIERAFLDDPIAQRLRYIAQAGLAHLVYPEVRTSRFAHSLGAMHLASRFLEAALRNADPELREAFEDATTAAVRSLAAGYMPDSDDVIRMFTADGLRTGAVAEGDARAVMLFVEQGLRLAALFHDLGHLPFSHDFEYALQQLFTERADVAERYPAVSQGSGAIHERIGYKAADLLLHQLHATFGELREIARLVFEIAGKILETEPPDEPELAVGTTLTHESVWGLLHRLIAGELDVDRCDYLLRDARAYGFEFASYDLDRLADNLVPVRVRPAVVDIAVRPQGVAAAESFMLARYRAYQWGPRHHKVAQIAAALQSAIRTWLEPVFTAPTTVGDRVAFMEHLETIAASDAAVDHVSAEPALRALSRYDDVWMLTELRSLADELPTDPWLGLITRRSRGPRSLWKRPDQFPAEDLAAWNDRLPDTDPAEVQLFEGAVARLAADDGVLVMRHHFRPYAPAPGHAGDPPPSALSVLTGDRGLLPLTELSQLTAGLWDVWRHDVQVQAFAAQPGGLSGADVSNALLPPTETAESNEEDDDGGPDL
jgi:HD superfamily phosphohydrolase